jgi:hypothetical protein
MTINAVKSTITAAEERAHTTGHPPVLGMKRVQADNGVYPGGLVCTENAQGELIPLTDPATQTVACVIDEPVDTAEVTAAVVLRHGTARADKLVMGEDRATALTAQAVSALETAGIYAQ